jgi:uncharacterized protein (TIGR02265 family)
MFRFVAELDVPLEGEADVAGAFARGRAGQLTKGMFFSRLAERLRDRWDDIERTLEKPPRLGRYVPFIDYPSRDHVLLVQAAARKSYPQIAEREAHRRLGRLALEDFRTSRVGSVFLAMLGGPRQALMQFPRGWKLSVRNSAEVRSEEKRDGVALHFVHGAVLEPEYLLGTIEAVVRHFGATPRTTVTIDGSSTIYDVELDAAHRRV